MQPLLNKPQAVSRLLRVAAGLMLIAGATAIGVRACSAQEEPNLVGATYIGHTSYQSFTRLVFETEGLPPDKFKVNVNIAEGQVIFYPSEGRLVFSFVPVRPVDDLVREVDFVQEDEAKRGIVVRLGEAATSVKYTLLADPGRIVIDVFRKTQSVPFMSPGRKVTTVAIDPGHGGRSAGAVTEDGLKEDDLALDVALRLNNLLSKQGFKTVLTRKGDIEASPDDRAGAANNARADLFVSLHAASSFPGMNGGASVYILDPEGPDNTARPANTPLWQDQQAPYLADSQALAVRLASFIGVIYGSKPPVRLTRLAGFSGLSMPAALVELGDLTDQAQRDQLSDDKFRDRLAGLLARAISDYARGTAAPAKPEKLP